MEYSVLRRSNYSIDLIDNLEWMLTLSIRASMTFSRSSCLVDSHRTIGAAFFLEILFSEGDPVSSCWELLSYFIVSCPLVDEWGDIFNTLTVDGILRILATPSLDAPREVSLEFKHVKAS